MADPPAQCAVCQTALVMLIGDRGPTMTCPRCKRSAPIGEVPNTDAQADGWDD